MVLCFIHSGLMHGTYIYSVLYNDAVSLLNVYLCPHAISLHTWTPLPSIIRVQDGLVIPTVPSSVLKLCATCCNTFIFFVIPTILRRVTNYKERERKKKRSWHVFVVYIWQFNTDYISFLFSFLFYFKEKQALPHRLFFCIATIVFQCILILSDSLVTLDSYCISNVSV